MSGTVQNNILRSSGTIAVSAAGLNWSDTIITGSTATVEAGNGYWINTTSNTCTITLPSSAESGDQIVLIDYARTWGTNKIIIDSNGLNYQGNDDTYTVEYNTDGQSVNIVYSDATKGWLPLEDDVVAEAPVAPTLQKAIFGFGTNTSNTKVSMTNLVGSNGVVGTDVTGVGTARQGLSAANYGGDKAIFAYGDTGSRVSISNLVNGSGVVASDTAGVGTERRELGAAEYGTDKAIFAFGSSGSGNTGVSNLVSNSGVIASDVSAVGTARSFCTGAGYGNDKAIFAYGYTSGNVNTKNLVNNSGVIQSDASGVGTTRRTQSSTTYGTDKAIYGYGYSSSLLNLTNLVSNSGVVASDTSGVGTARTSSAATKYGGDKAIFGYGSSSGGASGAVSISNLVGNNGVVASDTTGVGTVRSYLAAAGYGY